MSSVLEQPNDGRGKRLTDKQKNAILAKRLAGERVIDIANEFDINKSTVWRICKDVQQEFDEAQKDWRSRHASEAVEAVSAGLTCKDDPYKRMTGGIAVMRGLGLYSPDQVNQVAVMLSNMPADMRAELEQMTEDKPV